MFKIIASNLLCFLHSFTQAIKLSTSILGLMVVHDVQRPKKNKAASLIEVLQKKPPQNERIGAAI
jgi:hypothetical protein